jgi:hypothetical protein
MLPEASEWKKRWKTPRVPAAATLGSLMDDILAVLPGPAMLPGMFLALSRLRDRPTGALRELAGRLASRAASYAGS